MLHSICMISIANIINDWWITLLFLRVIFSAEVFARSHSYERSQNDFFSRYRFFCMNKFTSFHKIRIFASHFNTIFCDTKLSFTQIWINVRRITRIGSHTWRRAVFHSNSYMKSKFRLQDFTSNIVPFEYVKEF